jgi:hypothetical protein
VTVTEVGIELALAELPLEQVEALARYAEDAGIELVVLIGAEGSPDPWTTAVWLGGRTTTLRVVTDEPGSPYAPVAAKALSSAAALSHGRVETVGGDLTRIPASTTADVDAAVERAAEARRERRLTSRRPGIAYDDLPTSLAATAVEPGDRAYRSVSSTYMRGGSPGLVLRPRTADEVVEAVAFAQRHRNLPLGVRSGGHGVSGRSTNDGGLVVDLGAMHGIEVLDEQRRLIRVGPGARWKDVAAAIDSRGWAIGSGDYGGVGVGGLATAGGIGFLSREHGLTIDHLRAVEVVLADGTQVRASADEHADLFWAVRGAGANFGVVTAFELEAREVGLVGSAQLVVVVPDLAEGLRRFGEVASAAARDTTLFVVTGRPQGGQAVLQMYGVVDSPDPDTVIERLTPFAEIGTLVQQQVVLARYADVLASAADVGPEGHHGYGEPVTRSAYAPHLTPALATELATLLESGLVPFFQLRTMGGAIADVPADATAFAHRTPDFQVTAMGTDRGRLDLAWDALGHHFDGLYLSFETDLRPERLLDAFPPATLDRLRTLKRRYDPDNLFRDNFNIDPTPLEALHD